MRLTQDLALEQKQQLIMTPKLQQAIKLLQLSTVELKQSLEEELLANPVLELQQTAADDKEELPDSNGEEDLEWEEYFANSNYSYQSSNDKQKQEVNFEDFGARPENLEEHLNHQLQLLISSPQEEKIGEYIIGNLNDKGFLELGVEEIARDLSLSLEKVNSVLSLVQSLDPLGIAAPDLKSSLLMQLKALNTDTLLAEKIISNHFHDLGQHRIKELAEELGVSRGEIQQALDLIMTLNPYPAANFNSQKEGVKFLKPDLIVQEIEGKFYILTNDFGPRLRINAYYRKLLRNMDHQQAQQYLKERLDSALWLIRAIEQRRLTIYRTMEAIIDFQRSFFSRGIKYLRPLTMQQVAEQIGVHESTVSRATTNKYVQTAHGLFELKFFFASGIHRHQGQDLAATSIKKMIEDLIKREDKASPLSDQKIVERLAQEGIRLSRRTVAKYRQQLSIPSSTRRRRYD